MELTVHLPTKVEASSIRIFVPVRYDEDDIPNDFPFRAGDTWDVVVDLETGKIKDWPGLPEDTSFSMKVTDSGVYTLLDKNGNQVAGSKVIDDYVPDCIPNSYGDYLDFTITKDGQIKDWSDDCTEYAIEEAFFHDLDS